MGLVFYMPIAWRICLVVHRVFACMLWRFPCNMGKDHSSKSLTQVFVFIILGCSCDGRVCRWNEWTWFVCEYLGYQCIGLYYNERRVILHWMLWDRLLKIKEWRTTRYKTSRYSLALINHNKNTEHRLFLSRTTSLETEMQRIKCGRNQCLNMFKVF